MQWHSVAEFLDMGGYAFYVWGSFGITALVMVIEVWQVRARHRHIVRNLFNENESHTDSTHPSP